MPTRIKRLLAVMIFGGNLLMAGHAGSVPSTNPIDLSAMTPGWEPDNFTSWRTGNGGPAEWRVVTDLTAVRETAIAQVSTDTTDYRFPLAVYRPVSVKNVDASVRFKPVAGKIDQAGGIAVRLTTCDDYYVARECA